MTVETLVKSIDENVEEQVTLIVAGVEIICFASICPYEIIAGKTYPVEFEIMLNDDYEIEQINSVSSHIQKIGSGFAYKLSGEMLDGTIDCGIPFYDDYLISEYGYLRGKLVSLNIDRMDVEFK